MKLREAQSKFSFMLGQLIAFAYSKGYELTFGDVWARSGHCKNSLHYIRLAADLNLFKDGTYLDKSEDHKELGEFWEGIGGAWGGRFKDGKDGNHYSLEWRGMK